MSAIRVLQGPILSPFLHSVYINKSLGLFRDQLLEDDRSISDDEISRFVQLINCLLYADDIILIVLPTNLHTLLARYVDHRHTLCYSWCLSKGIIVALSTYDKNFSLYGSPLPSKASLPFFFILIYLSDLVEHSTMQLWYDKTSIRGRKLRIRSLQLESIPRGSIAYSRYVSIAKWSVIKMEYDLTVSALRLSHI